MTLRILVVCTANACRSPVVEHLLARDLAAAGVTAEVRSVGTRGGFNEVDAETVRAAHDVGVDVRGHRSRPLTADAVVSEGADLVLAMTREHLREVVALEPSAWSRTFTLKELARRGAGLGPARSVGEWVAAASEGRAASEMIVPSPHDDLPDPYGGPPAGYRSMVQEVAELSRVVAAGIARANRT